MDEKKKMIVRDLFLQERVLGFWKEWEKLEKTSKWPDRAQKAWFVEKVDKFNDKLDLSMNIVWQGVEDILRYNLGVVD